MKHTIAFRTLSQKILFVTELVGQISDGMWENSRPRDHYKNPCSAHVIVDPITPGLSFFPARRYDFASAQLLEIVGARMLNAVKLYTAFPYLPFDDHHTLSFEGTASQFVDEVWAGLSKSDQYYVDRSMKIIDLFKATMIEDLKACMAAVDRVQYTMADMKKDLREMKTVFNETTTEQRPLRPLLVTQ